MRGWRIERRGYSRNPWRIVTADGLEVPVGREVVSTYDGDIELDVVGWATKAEAVEALGTIAALMWQRLREQAA